MKAYQQIMIVLDLILSKSDECISIDHNGSIGDDRFHDGIDYLSTLRVDWGT